MQHVDGNVQMTRNQLLTKIDWEGGLEAYFDYGFHPDEIEDDPELRAIAERAYAAWTYFDTAGDEMMDLLYSSDECE